MKTIEDDLNTSDDLDSSINTKLNELASALKKLLEDKTVTGKEYFIPKEIEKVYGIKQSLQAKLRMDKVNGPPYVRPSGSRVVLYNKKDFETWLSVWRVS